VTEIGKGSDAIHRVYDFYGSEDADSGRLSDIIGEAAQLKFTLRVSSDRGRYYIAEEVSGGEIVVESNEAEDEEGRFVKKPEYATYATLVLAWKRGESELAACTFPDALRERLSTVAGLVFLHRHSSTRPRPSVDHPPPDQDRVS